MRKIWCFEVWKNWREILDGKTEMFFLAIQNEREREEIGGERKVFLTNHVVPRHPQAVGGAWPTREQKGLQAVGPTASTTASPCGPRPGLSSPAHSRFVGPYLERPNSEFKSKGSFSGSGAEPDLGPVAGRDYEPFMPTEDEAVIWPSDEEIEDEEDSEGPPAAG
ncbi:hypothetical protein LWI29_018564 [Acer saccharum]|uniref:Uncharacterized protein n=1 Tax=Acer saccharum TaxID=4024 RepID=A0AA39W6P6_ACESA|nr:hypothetical protein LWI29_018564 [Acer saccharum]